MKIKEAFADVTEWQKRFSPSVFTLVLKLQEEATEVLEASAALLSRPLDDDKNRECEVILQRKLMIEIADCMFILNALSEQLDLASLDDVADEKLEINKKRSWVRSHSGIYKHVDRPILQDKAKQ